MVLQNQEEAQWGNHMASEAVGIQPPSCRRCPGSLCKPGGEECCHLWKGDEPSNRLVVGNSGVSNRVSEKTKLQWTNQSVAGAVEATVTPK